MRESTGPSTYPGVTWGRKRPNISLSSESSSFILTRAKLALGTHVRFLGTGIHRLGEMTSSELNERGSIWDGAGWARIWGHLRLWVPNEVEARREPKQPHILARVWPWAPCTRLENCLRVYLRVVIYGGREAEGCGGTTAGVPPPPGQFYSHPSNLPFWTSGHSRCRALRAQISPGQLVGSWPQPLQAVLFLRQPRHSHTGQTKAYGSSPLTHIHQSLPKIPTQEARLLGKTSPRICRTWGKPLLLHRLVGYGRRAVKGLSKRSF